MSLQILAVGLPRTGSSSLKQALIDLGFGGCMHMDELFNQPKLVDLWIELYETGKTDTETLFSGYQSSTDFPGALLYKELLAVYPDLKIIINNRDAESWYKSMINTVHDVVPHTEEDKAVLKKKGEDIHPRFLGIAKTLELVEAYLFEKYFGGDFLDKEKTIARYNEHTDRVRAEVPASQLFEFDVKDGWDPLCEFLDVPVPTEDFPFKNKTKDFQEQVGGMIKGGGALKIK